MSQLSCGCLVPRPFKRVRLALGRWGRGLVTGHRFMLTCFNTGLGTHHGAVWGGEEGQERGGGRGGEKGRGGGGGEKGGEKRGRRGREEERGGV